jgi:hypothetical protein
MTSNRCKWSKDQIRAARGANLPELLRTEGLRLRETGGGNFQLLDYAGLVLKDSYWRWPQRDMQGNAIDFFVKVLGRSFAQAMERIAG